MVIGIIHGSDMARQDAVVTQNTAGVVTVQWHDGQTIKFSDRKGFDAWCGYPNALVKGFEARLILLDADEAIEKINKARDIISALRDKVDKARGKDYSHLSVDLLLVQCDLTSLVSHILLGDYDKEVQ